MAQTAHGEARGEPYVGRVAIAAVVLNQLENPAFPKTISGIIFNPESIYRSPGRTNLVDAKYHFVGFDRRCHLIFQSRYRYFQMDLESTANQENGKHIFAK
jgi:hypothetical protein